MMLFRENYAARSTAAGAIHCRKVALVFFATLLSLSPTWIRAQEGSTTVWHNAAGAKIEAEFVRLTDDGVILRLKSNGQEAEVPLATLSLASHLQAIKLSRPEEFSKPLPKAEVPPERLEPSNPIEIDESLNSPFSGDETIDQFLDRVTSEFKDGNYFVLWHCLPIRLQNDIAKLAAKGMTKVGDRPLGQIAKLLKDASDVVTQKEEFIFNLPDVQSNPMLAGPLKAQWPYTKEFVIGLADEDLWKPENFEEENIPTWLAKLMAVFGQHHSGMDETTGGMNDMLLGSLFKIVSQTSTTAELEFTPPNAPPMKVKAKKLGKIWVVTKWMLALRKGVDEGLAKVDSAPDVGSSITTALAFTAVPVVTSLKNAATQEDFNAAVENIKSVVGGMIPAQMQGGLGGAGAMAPGF